MCRTARTVETLWREWTVGLGGDLNREPVWQWEAVAREESWIRETNTQIIGPKSPKEQATKICHSKTKTKAVHIYLFGFPARDLLDRLWRTTLAPMRRRLVWLVQ